MHLFNLNATCIGYGPAQQTWLVADAGLWCKITHTNYGIQPLLPMKSP